MAYHGIAETLISNGVEVAFEVITNINLSADFKRLPVQKKRSNNAILRLEGMSHCLTTFHHCKINKCKISMSGLNVNVLL